MEVDATTSGHRLRSSRNRLANRLVHRARAERDGRVPRRTILRVCRRRRNSQLWRKNINIVNLGLVICSKHDVPGDGRHETLGSVSKIVANGNKAVFDESGSFIENKRSRERMWMREENGVYVLDVYVASPDHHEKRKDFHRQGIR